MKKREKQVLTDFFGYLCLILHLQTNCHVVNGINLEIKLSVSLKLVKSYNVHLLLLLDI